MKTELPKKTYTAMMQTDFAENVSTLWQDVIEKNDVIELLGCPNLRRGVYEFGVDLNIDTL